MFFGCCTCFSTGIAGCKASKSGVLLLLGRLTLLCRRLLTRVTEIERRSRRLGWGGLVELRESLFRNPISCIRWSLSALQ